MNKLIVFRNKWIELEPSIKKLWVFGIFIAILLLSWQAYSNYEYHTRQASKKSINSTLSQSGSFNKLSAIDNSNSQNTDLILRNSLLPQTNRNLGLEDLKADFENTRQAVLEGKDELRQMAEQNKLLQSKILLLEQAGQGAHNNTIPLSQSIGLSTPVVTGTSVSLKSNLPPPIDFNQEESSSPDSTRWTDSDSHLNLIKSPISAKQASLNSATRAPNVSNQHHIRQWSAQEQAPITTSHPNASVTIPASAVIDAVMLSGINARTSATGGTTGGSIIAANNVGSPFISRIKGSAILPNGWRVADLTDCFLSGTGIGILSTERANVTADKLTCISPTGLIYEAKIKAYGVDLDGIQGLSGRLVTKQGSILAKEAAAGMFAGVGTAFSPQPLPAYSASATSGSQQGYVLPNAGLIAGSAVGQGVSTSLGQLSKFYLDYARQMFPIVEVNAGTRVSWVVQESFDLVSSPSK